MIGVKVVRDAEVHFVHPAHVSRTVRQIVRQIWPIQVVPCSMVDPCSAVDPYSGQSLSPPS